MESKAMVDQRDQSLIVEARQGSAAALGQLVESYRSYLLSLANRELPTVLRAKVSASDIVQDTVLHACREFPQFSGRTGGELAAWLRQILRNNLIDARRLYQGSQKRQVSREAQHWPADSSQDAVWPVASSRENSPSTYAVSHEETQRLERALRRLSDSHRTVVLLRNRDGLSFPAIAQHMGRSAGSLAQIVGHRH